MEDGGWRPGRAAASQPRPLTSTYNFMIMLFIGLYRIINLICVNNTRMNLPVKEQ